MRFRSSGWGSRLVVACTLGVGVVASGAPAVAREPVPLDRLPKEWTDTSGKAWTLAVTDGAVTFGRREPRWTGEYDAARGWLDVSVEVTRADYTEPPIPEAVWAQVQQPLKQRMELRVERDPKQACLMRLVGTWTHHPITWTAKDRKLVRIERNKQVRVVFTGGRRYDMPGLGNWLNRIDWEGGVPDAVKRGGCLEVLTSRLLGFFADSGALDLYGEFGATLLKSFLAGSDITGVTGAETFIGDVGKALAENLAGDALSGKIDHATWMDALASGCIGHLLGDVLDGKTREELGKKLAEYASGKGREAAGEFLEQRLSGDGEVTIKRITPSFTARHFVGCAYQINGAAFVDRCRGTATVTLHVPACPTTKGAPCPETLVSCQVGNLPEEGRAQRTPANVLLNCTVVGVGR